MKLLTGLLVLGSISSFAGGFCPDVITYSKTTYTKDAKKVGSSAQLNALVTLDDTSGGMTTFKYHIISGSTTVEKSIIADSKFKKSKICLIGSVLENADPFIGRKSIIFVNSIISK